MTRDELSWFEEYDPEEYDDDGFHLMDGIPRGFSELTARERRVYLSVLAYAVTGAFLAAAAITFLVTTRG